MVDMTVIGGAALVAAAFGYYQLGESLPVSLFEIVHLLFIFLSYNSFFSRLLLFDFVFLFFFL
jgi:hypothetical protein